MRMNTSAKTGLLLSLDLFLDTLGCESVIHDVSEALAYSPLGSVGTWTTSTTVKK